MTTRPVTCLAACVASLYGLTATAATVIPSTGEVFISQGAGFYKINGATLVRVGDSVMVGPDGLAQVQLDDGNVVTVSPGEVMNVPAKIRPKDTALPGGAHPTQAGSGNVGGLIGALGVLAGGAAVAAALATSGGGSAPVVTLRPASP